MPRSLIAISVVALMPAIAMGHGDVAPQPVNTDALPEIGDEWLEENPYRAEAVGEDVWAAPFHIPAKAGNKGTGAEAAVVQQVVPNEAWVLIDPMEVLGTE